MKVQTILYIPCPEVGHTDCTRCRRHTGEPTRSEMARYDVDRDMSKRDNDNRPMTTYRLTPKGNE